jgi:hypothetical protein
MSRDAFRCAQHAQPRRECLDACPALGYTFARAQRNARSIASARYLRVFVLACSAMATPTLRFPDW